MNVFQYHRLSQQNTCAPIYPLPYPLPKPTALPTALPMHTYILFSNKLSVFNYLENSAKHWLSLYRNNQRWIKRKGSFWSTLIGSWFVICHWRLQKKHNLILLFMFYLCQKPDCWALLKCVTKFVTSCFSYKFHADRCIIKSHCN